jgi:hypothetical protein
MDVIEFISIPVAPQTAAALTDERRRAAVGRMLDRMEAKTFETLADVLVSTAADARARGLTDAMLDEELAAYNAERRD